MNPSSAHGDRDPGLYDERRGKVWTGRVIAIVKQTDPNEGSILVTDAPGIVRPVSQTQWFSKIVQKSPD